MWRFSAKKLAETKKLLNDNYQLICSWTNYLLEIKKIETHESSVQLIQTFLKINRVSLQKSGETEIDCSLSNNQFLQTLAKNFPEFRKNQDMQDQIVKLPKNMDAGNLQGYFYEQISSGFFLNMLKLMGYGSEKMIVETSAATKAKIDGIKQSGMDMDLVAGKNVADVKSSFNFTSKLLISTEQEILQALTHEKKISDDLIGIKLESKGLIIIQRATSKLSFLSEETQKNLANQYGLTYILRVFMDQDDFYMVENLKVRAIEDSNDQQ